MSKQLRGLGRKVTDRLNSESQGVRRRWQAIIGVTFMAVFVVASVAVNQTVLALNKAAGNYGYVSGTYGYNASVTSSDALPAAPTSLSSTPTVSGADLSWTAPTLTTTGTSLNNLSSYKIHYNTSSLSSCSGGSSTTSSSASATLTGLTASTTYYVAVCAVDGNTNDSAALTGSFATVASSSGGGGGGGSGSVFGAVVSDAAQSAAPGTPASVAVQAVLAAIQAPRNAASVAAQLGVAAPSAEALSAAQALVQKVIPAARLAALTAAVSESLKAFVVLGPEGVTAAHPVVKIGAGERASLLEAFQHSQGGTLPTTARQFQFLTAHIVDPDVLASGSADNDVTKLFPDLRNLTIEGDGLKDFTNCNARPPSVDTKGVKLVKAQQDKEWAFVKYTGYQLKVDPAKRSLGAEAAAIKKFKTAKLSIYKNGVKTEKAAGKNPADLFDWNFIRAATYSGAPTTCLK
ncbi:MAG: fibronectin type III domain-containing protein [bacterium]|nr:fibronectin type III domain-containing protein [bacterium]